MWSPGRQLRKYSRGSPGAIAHGLVATKASPKIEIPAKAALLYVRNNHPRLNPSIIGLGILSVGAHEDDRLGVVLRAFDRRPDR